jgi:hypothetical protein
MKGVQFVVDEAGNQQAVLIDLKKNRQLWEDFYDAALAAERESDPRETLDEVRRTILGDGK